MTFVQFFSERVRMVWRPQHPHNSIVKAFAAAALVMMAGCQSISDIDTAALEAELVKKQAAEIREIGIETVGTGPTSIALILDSPSNEKQKGFRDGATLAMKDLCAGALTLLMANDGTRVGILDAIQNTKPDLIAFTTGIAEGNGTVEKLIRLDVPLIALGYSGSTKIHSFVPNGLDSMIAGLRYAISGQKNRVVLVVPKNQAILARARISRALGSSIRLLKTIPYDPANASTGFSNKNLQLLKDADIVAFAGSDSRISKMAAVVQSGRVNSSRVTLVGNDNWPSTLIQSVAQPGTIIATRDNSGLNLIERRYRNAYGKSLSQSAAFAYDIVAVAAGIVRKNGKPGIPKSALQSPSGFRGATGLFRFRDNGRVERLYQIAMIENGELKIIDEGQTGF
ncbi:MAG: hypothetical protein ACR2PF_20520 [Rhizobiaceae bacterium]